jgi:hypothetical protein
MARGLGGPARRSTSHQAACESAGCSTAIGTAFAVSVAGSGTAISRTPLRYVALTAFESMPSGSAIARSKLP